MSDMRALLNETYGYMKKKHDYKLSEDPRHFYGMIRDKNAFGDYLLNISEGLQPKDKEDFYRMAVISRRVIAESANSMTQLNPYETLTIPILRNFYPKLVSKELVNVMPIDKPEVIKAFIKIKFNIFEPDSSGYGGYNYEFPSMNQDISRGPSIGFDTEADNTSGEENILTKMNITSATPAHIEKDFRIIGVLDSTGGVVTDVNIVPTVDGVFSVEVVHKNTDTDVVSGHIDYETGIFHWSSKTGDTGGVRYVAHASLEQNSINPRAKIYQEKIPFKVVDRRITSEWTTLLEQDLRALYDVSIQSEFVNAMGEQIALDIDRENIDALFQANEDKNPGTHTRTFNKHVGSGLAQYALGSKDWAEEILTPLGELSAQIFNTTNMGQANTVACNPIDATIFERLNGYEFLGDATAGGEAGYRSATVASGKWKILTSQVIEQGKMLVKYRSNELQRAAFVFAPYVPAMITPYPLGANPSLTILSRYASRTIRPGAIGQLNIINESD